MPSSSRYEPLALIGRGSTCEIWLGVLEGAESFKKPVVLKRACVGVNEDLEEARRSLIDEAHLSASLTHPNIVHVYELVDLPEGVMLAMEYLSGLSVRSIVTAIGEAGGSIPWGVSARIIADAARGLEYAHQAKSATGAPLSVVHRDVSPDNMVVTEEGITKVVDFGIARSSMRDPTVALVVKGNVGYLSPEQARGEELDWRSDVFSLGVVLHELFTGAPLFEREKAGKALEALLAAPIPEVPNGVAVVARDLVRRMLVREARGRSLPMGEVADVLESVASSAGGSHRDVSAFLHAEFGRDLEQRRKVIKDLIEHPESFETKTQAEGATAVTTITAIDAALAPRTTAALFTVPTRNDELEDTEVDAGLPGTLIERPLLEPPEE